MMIVDSRRMYASLVQTIIVYKILCIDKKFNQLPLSDLQIGIISILKPNFHFNQEREDQPCTTK